MRGTANQQLILTSRRWPAVTAARRYAATEAVGVVAAGFAVAAVVILAGLAWLWLFRK
jgi:hypothetical protein